MKRTSCTDHTCLNRFTKHALMPGAQKAVATVFCLALIESPAAPCRRYVPPSWIEGINRKTGGK